MSRHAVIENGVVINTIDYVTTPNPVPTFSEDVIAVPSDTASIGWLYSNDTFTDPNALSLAEQTTEAWVVLRRFRNNRLTMCDWTQAVDTQLTAEQVEDWRVYRQVLRDLPANTANPLDHQWPTTP